MISGTLIEYIIEYVYTVSDMMYRCIRDEIHRRSDKFLILYMCHFQMKLKQFCVCGMVARAIVFSLSPMRH
jgi:hypothetical protein